MINALLASVCFCVGNFLYECLVGDRNWKRAFERSFFQALAIVCYEIVC